jgi:hypothetical protein
VDKRFQVFVSSTFEDLREERAAVISALLQLECFPAGMELFPAADDDSLTLIKSVIDDSDYYLVIVGGRYGTIDPTTGKSYTHLEYEYALSTGKPIIALLHSDPGALQAAKTEANDAGRKRLEDFRAELKKRNCRHWRDRSELVAGVFTGIQHLKKTRPAVGWVKTPAENETALKDELLRVRREMETMAVELERARQQGITIADLGLAYTDETTDVTLQLADGNTYSFEVRWDEIIRSLLPYMLGAGATPQRIADVLSALARETADHRHAGPPVEYWDKIITPFSTSAKVLTQLVALGMIEAVVSTADPPVTLWRATPYGALEGCRLVAVRRK